MSKAPCNLFYFRPSDGPASVWALTPPDENERILCLTDARHDDDTWEALLTAARALFYKLPVHCTIAPVIVGTEEIGIIEAVDV